MTCDILTTALNNNDVATIDLLVSTGKYPLFKFVRIAEMRLKQMISAGSNLHNTNVLGYDITMWNHNICRKYKRAIDLGSFMYTCGDYITHKTKGAKNHFGKVILLRTYGDINYLLRTSLNYLYERRYSRAI